MKILTKEEFINIEHCIYIKDFELWVKHSKGERFTTSLLFDAHSAIVDGDGINVCQSDWADKDFYYILDEDEKKCLIELLK
jgi:hypothetical protein